jgi:chromosome partitioning protein
VKLISTLNFKGGVGKTTVTWLLARYLVERREKKVLVLDADPQMSLTTAVELLEVGIFEERFNNWYKEVKEKKANLYQLLLEYGQSGSIPTTESPFYIHRPNLYLLPSDEELYWYDLEALKAQDLRGFMGSLLKSMEERADFPKFDYCLADCPPAFNSLSFSVVSNSDLVLIPINPDVFASKGVEIMLSGLKKRLQPLPPFLIFMNRARARVDRMTREVKLARESSDFLNSVTSIVELEKREAIPVSLLRQVFIPERKGIKDALAATRLLPPDLETYFKELWNEIETQYFQPNTAPKVEGLSVDALKGDYEQLKVEFTREGGKAVQEFVRAHSSVYLDEFIKANTLPIPTKASKQAVEEALVSSLAQWRVITRRR